MHLRCESVNLKNGRIMDTMAFVEKFLRKHEEYGFHANKAERRFDGVIKEQSSDISSSIICPLTDDKNDTPFDEIISIATLSLTVSKEHLVKYLKTINQICSKENTRATIYVNDKSQIEAHYRFQVWESISDKQLECMLLAPARILLKHKMQFLMIKIRDVMLTDPLPPSYPLSSFLRKLGL